MGRLKKLFVILAVFTTAVCFTSKPASADCVDPETCNGDQSCLNNLKASCEKSIVDAQSQQKTLASQINIANGRITLTKVQIQQTQDELNKLSDSIASLSGKIDTIQGSLAHTSEVLANRIKSTYITGRVDPLTYLLLSSNFEDFFQRYQYLRLVQKHDKELLINMALTQKNYDDQKGWFVDAKKKKEILSARLQADKAQLERQNREKQILLEVTRNDEARYQQLLAEAQAQLAAFGGFVNGLGGGTLISADPNWPSDYFSQRDTRWGNVIIAGFNLSGEPPTISKYGCLVTSVAMVVKHRGNSVTPLSIGTNSSYFDGAAMFRWAGLGSLGLNPQYTLDRSVINSALDQGKWVIVGLNYGPWADKDHSPFHFVVITEKRGNDYNLFDPFRGPNISFNSNYGSNYITEVITY